MGAGEDTRQSPPPPPPATRTTSRSSAAQCTRVGCRLALGSLRLGGARSGSAEAEPTATTTTAAAAAAASRARIALRLAALPPAPPPCPALRCRLHRAAPCRAAVLRSFGGHRYVEQDACVSAPLLSPAPPRTRVRSRARAAPPSRQDLAACHGIARNASVSRLQWLPLLSSDAPTRQAQTRPVNRHRL